MRKTVHLNMKDIWISKWGWEISIYIRK